MSQILLSHRELLFWGHKPTSEKLIAIDKVGSRKITGLNYYL